MKRLISGFTFLHFLIATVSAQVGEYRNDLAIGVNGGYVMSNVAFVTKVPQGQLGGMTGGFTARYTCEKYFSSICAVTAEVNFAQIGWNEDILDMNDKPVPLHTDPTQNLAYKRKMTYVQIITGEKPVDAFDDFVKQWYEMGGTQITEEANEWYHSR